MKRLLLALILVVVPFILGAQPPYIINEADVCLPPTTVITPICFTKSGNDVYVASNRLNGNDVGVFINALDISGSPLNSTLINGSCNEYLPFNMNMSKLGNNIFVSSLSNSYDGNIQNFHGPYDCTISPSLPYYDFMLTKTSTSGDFKWAKCYGGENPDHVCKNFISKEGNSIVLVGSITVAGNGDYVDPLSPINGQDFWLVEVDTINGSIIREKCFGSSTGNEFIYDAIQTSDKGYLLTGVTNFYPNNFMDAVLVKVDSLWNQQWMTIIPTPLSERGMLVLEDTVNGDIYWLINSNETDSVFQTTHYNTQDEWEDNFNNWLIKLNKNGDTTWIKFVGTPYGESTYQISILDHCNSSMIFNMNHEIVTITTSLQEYDGLNGAYDIRFMKLDTAGTILMERKFPEYLIINDILALDNGRYLCLAQKEITNNTTCTYTLVTLGETVGVGETVIDNFQIYPNPALDFVSIEIPKNFTQASLNIYNLTGQLISQKQITHSSKQITIPELGNGMYIFVIQNGDKVIGRQRVVVAR